jgi:hypothetical protein
MLLYTKSAVTSLLFQLRICGPNALPDIIPQNNSTMKPKP